MSDTERLALPSEARRQLGFLVTAHDLTGVDRVNRLRDGSRSETSAEHSWHLALMGLVLGDGQGLDVGRVTAMLLVHDIVEVDAGDVPIYDEAARLAIEAVEARAAERLFGLLPTTAGGDLRALWEEFEAAQTPEARFARAVDRLQPMVLHWAGDGSAWAARGVTVAQERAFAAQITTWWPALGPIAEAIVDDATARGMLCT